MTVEEEEGHDAGEVDLKPCVRCRRWAVVQFDGGSHRGGHLGVRGREFRCKACAAVTGIGQDGGVARGDTRFVGPRLVNVMGVRGVLGTDRPAGGSGGGGGGGGSTHQASDRDRMAAPLPMHPIHVHKAGAAMRARDKLTPRRSTKRKRGVGIPLHCTPNSAVVRGSIDGSLTRSGLPPGQYGCYLGKRKKVIGLCSGCSKFQMFDAKNQCTTRTPTQTAPTAVTAAPPVAHHNAGPTNVRVLQAAAVQPESRGRVTRPLPTVQTMATPRVPPLSTATPPSHSALVRRGLLHAAAQPAHQRRAQLTAAEESAATFFAENNGLCTEVEPAAVVGTMMTIDVSRHFVTDSTVGVPDYAAAAEAAAVARAKIHPPRAGHRGAGSAGAAASAR